MRRYNLSCKLPSSLEKSRKSAASDPEIIYEYFDNIKTEINRLKILERPECIWNIDETCLFIDPSKTKVVSPVGTKASCVKSTSGKEAITVMAALVLLGKSSPPLFFSRANTFGLPGRAHTLIQGLSIPSWNQGGWCPRY